MKTLNGLCRIGFACFLGVLTVSTYAAPKTLAVGPQSAMPSVQSTHSRKLFPIQRNRLWGYIDNQGTVKIEPQFQMVDNFSEGLAAVQLKGKWGYIDETGKVVIEPRFTYAFSFSEDLAAIYEGGAFDPNNHTMQGGQFLFIDRKGAAVPGLGGNNVRSFSEGLVAVQPKEKSNWLYLDKKGDPLEKFDDYSRAGDFKEGLAIVYVDKSHSGWSEMDKIRYNFQYIDKTGVVIFRPKLGYEGYDFSEGLAIGTDLRGFLWASDRTGKEIFRLRAMPLSSPQVGFTEGLALVCVYNSKCERCCDAALIDKTGKVIKTLAEKIGETGQYRENLCRVNLQTSRIQGAEDQWGYVDNTGQMKIAPVFLFAGDFEGGLARVATREKWGYINHSGQFVWSASRL